MSKGRTKVLTPKVWSPGFSLEELDHLKIYTGETNLYLPSALNFLS